MGESNSGGLELRHLRRGFTANFVGRDSVAQGGARKTYESGAKRGAVGEGRDALRRQDRRQLNEIDMAADGELRKRTRQRESVIEIGAAGHHGGRGHHAVAMGFGNGAVDPAREAEIVGVNDESLHLLSSGSRIASPEGSAISRFRQAV